ncbi:AsmA family protein [Herbaspirillum sp. RTI4]|uniref:AsmA family protein n=1 Tax=Herbaspirillum sp. RTI4 TaxID=3048640 RepID=UPI002AB38351|nr:AsmA family protein [Herbaspirillum sp. RTI4]MDY7577237.1 AsmA family protein [Herbaspirillum sp. RTI4]MEA9980527.1 AsmA family protein [Herbaspirillum sp. RTI4]
MHSLPKYVAWFFAFIVTLIILCAAILLNLDIDRFKPWLNQRISNNTGRHFAINGPLSLEWKKSQTAHQGWIPLPEITAQDIRLSNPDGASATEDMLKIDRLRFSVELLPLLQMNIVLPTLEMDAPSLSLSRSKSLQNNWTFKVLPPSAWNVRLERIAINKGSVQLNDAFLKIRARMLMDTLPQALPGSYGLLWSVNGDYNGAPIVGNGKAGSVLSLQNEAVPFPLEAKVQLGKSAIAFKGNLTKPNNLAAIDLQLSLSSDSMAHLFPLTGILLPQTPPFHTEGHLTGQLDKVHSLWTYDQFSGKVGASDLSGSVQYETSPQARPVLSGKVASRLLRLQDLGPVIGADSNASKQQRGAEERQPTGKVLPQMQFQTANWDALDADIQFTARQIVKDKNLHFSDLVTTIRMKDKVLTLSPLNFSMADGQLVSKAILDGRSERINAAVTVSARHLKIQKLFPALEVNQTSFGEINGDAHLSASGDSVAMMLGNSNGELKTLINQGAISKLLLEEMGLNLGNIAVSKMFGDKQVKLNCLVSDFNISHGVMDARTFLLDTEDALISVTGQINLNKEVIALKINPKSKGIRIFSLNAPLYVTGSFNQPDISVDKGVLALRAGGALALGLLAAPAALLPLMYAGSSNDDNCSQFLVKAGIKPLAAVPVTAAPLPGPTN